MQQLETDNGAREGGTSILAGPPFSNYKLPNCNHSELEPGAIQVDKAKYPGQVDGGGIAPGESRSRDEHGEGVHGDAINTREGRGSGFAAQKGNSRLTGGCP